MSFSCYPTLATDHVHLLLSGTTANTPAILTITDMHGRQMQQMALTLTGGQPASIDVTNYPAGVYIATIATANGRYGAKFIR